MTRICAAPIGTGSVACNATTAALIPGFRAPDVVVLRVGPDLFDTVQRQASNIVNETSMALRLDFKFNQKHSAYFRYFRDQGIALDVQNFDGGVQMVAPLAAGQLDIGAGGPGAVLYNAVERDIPIKVVGDNGSTPPGFGWQALLVRKALADSGAVREIADLRGRKVAIIILASSVEITRTAEELSPSASVTR